MGPTDLRFCRNCGTQGCSWCMNASNDELCDDCYRQREDADAEAAWGV